ncbi:MAG: molybdopterin molybdotransferase MoeA [Oligoflexia bacterium]|nr:molybdopterin molybdotransferase MoeA [Oligoflexia bacterium]
MISYEQSQQLLRDAANVYSHCEVEVVDIADSVGRVVAQDVVCRESVPHFDNSAMDGFAVKLSVIHGIPEVLNHWFQVNELVAAGDPLRDEITDDVVEIMTGAPLPSGHFNSVIRIEDVDVIVSEKVKMIRFKRMPRANENIRRVGEDSIVGSTILEEGTQISAQHLLILASQGITDVKVKRKLKVGILSTGKELVNHDCLQLQHGQIRNSTGLFLKHELSSEFTEVSFCGHVGDDPGKFINQMEALFDIGVEVIISTGAVSVGVFDFVRSSLEQMGAKIHFHKCAIRPGKPILFASLMVCGRWRFVFGMPGNPVSSVVGYNFFVKPFIYWIFGLERPRPVRAQLSADVKKPDGLKCFMGARYEKGENDNIGRVEPIKGHASFMVSPFKNLNAWIVLSEMNPVVKALTEVEVYQL